ncbi:hypothetical protein IPG41_01475 [Candidatus Peregrinibacteria bacterium]|nr:MAG: hypothetical protein IPG41_01475 [Candidatus Peregrinibacteria bacterium]
MPLLPHSNLVRLFILLAILAGTAFGLYIHSKPEPLVGDIHTHADFKVYLNGTAYDFAQEKYMSEEGSPLSPFAHLHDGDGTVIHKHMSGITLGDFFESIGMKLSETCFTLDNGTTYCNDAENTLKFFVNGKLNKKFDQYEFGDLDRLLLTYGDETEEELQIQVQSVGDKACIYSEQCPERGTPPDESSCTGATDGCLPAQAHTHAENAG